jgi:hypothetical protein
VQISAVPVNRATEEQPRWLVLHEFPCDGGGVSARDEVAPGLDERLHASILGKRLGTKLLLLLGPLSKLELITDVVHCVPRQGYR